MKVLIFPLIIFCAAFGVYLFSKPRVRKTNWFAISIICSVSFIFFGIGLLGFILSQNAVDTQCQTSHTVSGTPPSIASTALDFFILGNYHYDTGNCTQAVIDYTRAIALNPTYSLAYNNRAYTYMRMQEYKQAFIDLDTAISLRPGYIQALMNRGDLYNYYGPIINRQKAVLDYRKVIALGQTKSTSVCGHLFLAEHNGWNAGAILGFLTGEFLRCE